jgi:hypothetical protein
LASRSACASLVPRRELRQRVPSRREHRRGFRGAGGRSRCDLCRTGRRHWGCRGCLCRGCLCRGSCDCWSRRDCWGGSDGSVGHGTVPSGKRAAVKIIGGHPCPNFTNRGGDLLSAGSPTRWSVSVRVLHGEIHVALARADLHPVKSTHLPRGNYGAVALGGAPYAAAAIGARAAHVAARRASPRGASARTPGTGATRRRLRAPTVAPQDGRAP